MQLLPQPSQACELVLMQPRLQCALILNVFLQLGQRGQARLQTVQDLRVVLRGCASLQACGIGLRQRIVRVCETLTCLFSCGRSLRQILFGLRNLLDTMRGLGLPFTDLPGKLATPHHAPAARVEHMPDLGF